MVGDIHIFVFIDPSNQGSNNVAQETWFQTQHAKAGYIWTFVKGEQGVDQKARELRVSYPSIIFMREEKGVNNYLSLGRIVGNTSFAVVQREYLKYLNKAASSTGSPIGEGQSNSIIYGEGDKFGLGLGLANIKAPVWILIALGLYAISQQK